VEAFKLADHIRADSGRVQAAVRLRGSLAGRTRRAITDSAGTPPAPDGDDPVAIRKTRSTHEAHTTQATPHTTGADSQRTGPNHSTSNLTLGITRRGHNITALQVNG